MQELIQNPVVQAAVLPFAVGLVVAGVLIPFRLAGLAAAAGYLAATYAVGNFGFAPLTAMRKLVLIAVLAPVIGAVADLAFKPTRATGAVLGAVFAALAAWVFWSVLSQKSLEQGLALGAGSALLLAWLVAMTVSLHDDSIRAGAAGLGLGLGAGISAVLGASAVLGISGMALGAGSGAFLLLAMTLGRRIGAGVVLTLTVSVIAGLIGAGAMLLAQVPWSSLAALALVPALVRLPLPQKAPHWVQACVASAYAFVAAGGACVLAWLASRGN